MTAVACIDYEDKVTPLRSCFCRETKEKPHRQYAFQQTVCHIYIVFGLGANLPAGEARLAFVARIPSRILSGTAFPWQS